MFTFLKTWFGSSKSKQAVKPAKRPSLLSSRIRIEHLEDRLSPSALGLDLAPPVTGHLAPPPPPPMGALVATIH